MQQRNILMSIVIVLAVAGNASAQNQILSFGDGTHGVDFDIVDSAGTIVIYNANGNDYAFWAHDGSQTPGTGFIDNITLNDPNSMTGDFTLLIADPNHPDEPNKPGALNWKAGNLVYPGGTSTVLGRGGTDGLCHCSRAVPGSTS